MLDANPTLATSEAFDGELPLNWAVNFNRPDIAEALLAAGAHINAAGAGRDDSKLA